MKDKTENLIGSMTIFILYILSGLIGTPRIKKFGKYLNERFEKKYGEKIP